MAEAKPGQRVADRYGHTGTVVSIKRNEVTVKWDGGDETKVIASQLHPIGGRRWIPIAVALSLGLTIALLVWLR